MRDVPAPFEVLVTGDVAFQERGGLGAVDLTMPVLVAAIAIVTSAAALLVVVVAGFLLGGCAPVREIGVGLVVAIVLDATVVRMLLVPATMTLLGRAARWPGRVRPVLPNRADPASEVEVGARA